LNLPGVVETSRPTIDDPYALWPQVQPIVEHALDKLRESRTTEGQALESELKRLAESVGEQVEQIAELAPKAVTGYQDRLQERVQALVAEQGITVEPKDLIREVAIFAERSDVAEEIARLRAHRDQFLEILKTEDAPGRKLEFVVQEMGREANTIGSKATDVTISHLVVAIKGLLEQIREQVQNVE